MLAAIREMADKKDEFTKRSHVCSAEYLEACNLIFENGILSHEMIRSTESQALLNIREGMKQFINWKEELQKEPGNITLATRVICWPTYGDEAIYSCIYICIAHML